MGVPDEESVRKNSIFWAQKSQKSLLETINWF